MFRPLVACATNKQNLPRYIVRTRHSMEIGELITYPKQYSKLLLLTFVHIDIFTVHRSHIHFYTNYTADIWINFISGNKLYLVQSTVCNRALEIGV